MSTTNQKVTLQQKCTDTFYWVGITMSVLCIAFAAAGNTELISRLQVGEVPLSWVAGGIAIIAFLASEYFHPPAPAKVRGARRVSEERMESPAFETEFADV